MKPSPADTHVVIAARIGYRHDPGRSRGANTQRSCIRSWGKARVCVSRTLTERLRVYTDTYQTLLTLGASRIPNEHDRTVLDNLVAWFRLPRKA